MKTTVKLILLAITVSLLSCSKSNDDNINPSPDKTEQVSGTWAVTYFYDSGKDETHKFNGYNFVFDANGTLLASGTTGSYNGTWRIGDSSSDDDSSSNKLVILITGSDAMDELQDDWLIIKLTDNEIWLKDDGDNSDEELRFGR